MAEKDKIYLGDTYTAVYEVRKRAPNDDFRGLPLGVVSAFARLKNLFEGTDIELGGPGVFEDPCTITPPTGATVNDTGAIVSYTVDSAFTDTIGTYTLFITGIFADGTRLTENRKFSVLELK